MNKELEETKIFLKQMLNEYKRFGDLQDEKFEDTDRIYNQLEIALNYIDNSIPKEKIEEKIKELEKEYKQVLEENSIKAFILKCQLEILQEILEGK